MLDDTKMKKYTAKLNVMFAYCRYVISVALLLFRRIRTGLSLVTTFGLV